MFLNTLDLIIIGLGFLLLLVWIIFFFKGNKYAPLFETLIEKEYPLKEIYGVGYAVMETIHYGYKSKADRQLRQEIEVLYGRKYVDYYMHIIYAQKVTLSFTLVVFAFILYGLSQEIAAFGVGLIFAWLAFYYFGTTTKKRILTRSGQILMDFSEVVSQLALLTNAGMILKDAWKQTAYAGESEIYKEMQLTVENIQNGMAEVDAYHEFGKRCVIAEIKKFSATIIQGVKKGNSELTIMLQQQSKEIWNAKSQNIKRQGEKAGSKLLMPMMIMFVGILVMILVPIFSNLGV